MGDDPSGAAAAAAAGVGDAGKSVRWRPGDSLESWVPGLSGGPEGLLGWDEASSSAGEVGSYAGGTSGREEVGEATPAGADDAAEGKAEGKAEVRAWRPVEWRRDVRLILGVAGVVMGALAVRVVVGSLRRVERLKARLEETEREARRVRLAMESTVKRERGIAESSLENVEKLHGLVQERNHKIAALRRQLKDAEARVLETVVRAFHDMEASDQGADKEAAGKEDENDYFDIEAEAETKAEAEAEAEAEADADAQAQVQVQVDAESEAREQIQAREEGRKGGAEG